MSNHPTYENDQIIKIKQIRNRTIKQQAFLFFFPLYFKHGVMCKDYKRLIACAELFEWPQFGEIQFNSDRNRQSELGQDWSGFLPTLNNLNKTKPYRFILNSLNKTKPHWFVPMCFINLYSTRYCYRTLLLTHNSLVIWTSCSKMSSVFKSWAQLKGSSSKK